MAEEPENCQSAKANEVGQAESVTESVGEEGGKRDAGKADTAAVQVQRLYRGYRTRRNIADAAVMAQKFGWWNVVDGAILQHTTSQFYAYSKPQNAAQRWVRLKKKAAKVGKGLSKNDSARKLALQHWLEAIDPRHRYGHNLQFYYEEWSNSDTQEPFFYWLDVGEGKDLELEKCKKSKLQTEQISYLSPKERKWFEVLIEEGKLVYKMTEKPVDTPKGEKWIFVMSTSGKLYVGKKEKGKLQHSSFLAGGATTAAGRLVVRNGTIELMEAHSGHYHPTPENFRQLISILTSSGADLTMAKVQFVSDDMLSDSLSSNARTTAMGGLSQQGGGNDDSGSPHMIQEEDVPNVEVVPLCEGTDPVKSNTTVVAVGTSELERSSVTDTSVNGFDHLKGFTLEIMKPARKFQSFREEREAEKAAAGSSEVLDTSSSQTALPVLNKHKLFGPAMRTFSRLDIDYCTRAVREHDSQTASQLNPKTKLHLIRRLSMSRPVEIPA